MPRAHDAAATAQAAAFVMSSLPMQAPISIQTLPPTGEDARPARALLAHARPLITLATQLRQSALDAPEAMKQALAAAIARFERDAAAAGCDERSVVAASYLLCVWIDEAVDDTPWGAGGAGLLQRFHGEHDGSTKVLQLLSRLAERPSENRALLELYHACLSLGLQGALRGSPEAPKRLEALRRRVYQTLPHPPLTLSAPLRTAVPPGTSPLKRRLALGALPLLGLLALGVYTTSHLLLARRVDEVFASMQQLAPPSGIAQAAAEAASGAGTIVAARAALPLAPLLAADRAAGRLVVSDEAHRSVVSIPAEQLFEAGSTRPGKAGIELLARVAGALAGSSGKVLVIGHTDGADTRTARLPSAWHQSYEWASETVEVLGRTLPPARLAAEGAAEIDARDAPSAPRRRVDIVLYP
jgi:type VI secretion system protein ImpK